MFGPFSIDTIFPAFHRLEDEFGVAPELMQLTISAYLAAFAIGSLIHGPLSDALGRRRVLVAGILVYGLASAGGAVTHDFNVLLLVRAMQGASAGVGVIVGRAIIRDCYEGAAAQKLMSQVALVFGVAPAIAPIVGGWVFEAMGWRAIFWGLGLYAALLIVIVLGVVPETLPEERRQPLSPGSLVRTYKQLLSDTLFLRMAGTVALSFGGLFLVIASAPVVVLDLLHLGPRDFGWLFVPIIGGLTLGSSLSGRVAGVLSFHGTLRCGYAILFVGGIAEIAVSAWLRPHVPWTLLPLTVYAAGTALLMPSLTLAVLDRLPRQRGAASSMQATIQLAFNSVVAAVFSPLACGSLLNLGIGSLLLSGAGLLLMLGSRRALPAEAAPLP